jgi:hypothetical protein
MFRWAREEEGKQRAPLPQELTFDAEIIVTAHLTASGRNDEHTHKARPNGVLMMRSDLRRAETGISLLS